VIHRTNCNFK